MGIQGFRDSWTRGAGLVFEMRGMRGMRGRGGMGMGMGIHQRLRDAKGECSVSSLAAEAGEESFVFRDKEVPRMPGLNWSFLWPYYPWSPTVVGL